MGQIDIEKRFKASLCTFEMSKKVAAAGMTCANLYFAYDEDEEVSNGAWLEKLGYKVYPCMDFTFAITMLSEVLRHPHNLQLQDSSVDGYYKIIYKNKAYDSKNIVDVVLMCWLDNK